MVTLITKEDNMKNIIYTKGKSGIELNVDSVAMREKIEMSPEEFQNFSNGLLDLANAIWDKNFELKEVTSMGNDYFEYYDRKYDNNGYLSIKKNADQFIVDIEKPCLESHRFYLLNKAKAQTFINDCLKLLNQ